ncbi:hypothetical protein KY290_015982 [Solanum tuberosum]|uniref:Uncharacterized protein n=1 Tax=Solanum tuberosum TaxID=4113 RepID=A0ABQ7VU08_SOLTU|nr:hypothetical protein KY289_014422 [Solanum tuberosum]KAH0699550.1 hypothetical protein KY284_013765 [Solanum tuberosum]KAH0772001.1 hypothetical protein KY290_015982 [Solanum tuberosum]
MRDWRTPNPRRPTPRERLTRGCLTRGCLTRERLTRGIPNSLRTPDPTRGKCRACLEAPPS